MSVKDLSTVSRQDQAETTSICIVGAGAAGLVLAQSLVARGLDVVVLESGGAQIDDEVEALNAIDNANGRWTGAFRSRCRGIGGTSQLWGGRCIPISTSECEARPYLGDLGWPFRLQQLDRYTSGVETLLKLDHSSFDGLEEGGLPGNDEDFACRWAKWPRFADCNLSLLMRKEMRTNRRLRIWSNATVTDWELDTDHGRVRSLTARNKTGNQVRVFAQHFVLAAGTVETTRLLLWLRRSSNDRALATCQVLGHYFQDHLDISAATISRKNAKATNRLFGYRFSNSVRRSIHLELSRATQQQAQVGSAFAYITMDLDNSSLNAIKSVARQIQRGQVNPAEIARLSVQLKLLTQSLLWRMARRQLFVPADAGFKLHICAEQAPAWDNSITLSPRHDMFGVPLPRIKWTPTLPDEQTLRTAVAAIERFWNRQGWNQLAPLQWSAAVQNPQARLIDLAEDYYHPSGSARMGTDPSTSVVNANLTCHGIPNLSALSAATFPRAGSANPTFTIMRMALRLADHLEALLAHSKPEAATAKMSAA